MKRIALELSVAMCTLLAVEGVFAAWTKSSVISTKNHQWQAIYSTSSFAGNLADVDCAAQSDIPNAVAWRPYRDIGDFFTNVAANINTGYYATGSSLPANVAASFNGSDLNGGSFIGYPELGTHTLNFGSYSGTAYQNNETGYTVTPNTSSVVRYLNFKLVSSSSLKWAIRNFSDAETKILCVSPPKRVAFFGDSVTYRSSTVADRDLKSYVKYATDNVPGESSYFAPIGLSPDVHAGMLMSVSNLGVAGTTACSITGYTQFDYVTAIQTAKNLGSKTVAVLLGGNDVVVALQKTPVEAANCLATIWGAIVQAGMTPYAVTYHNIADTTSVQINGTPKERKQWLLDLNTEIVSKANQNSISVIDLENSWSLSEAPTYLEDSVHPNIPGAKKIAAKFAAGYNALQ